MQSVSHDEATGAVLSVTACWLAPESSPRTAPSHQAHPNRVSRVSRAAMRLPNQLRKVASTAAARPRNPVSRVAYTRQTFTHRNTDFDESLTDEVDGAAGQRS